MFKRYYHINKLFLFFAIFFFLSVILEAKEESQNPVNKNRCGTFLSDKEKKILTDNLCDSTDSNGRCIMQKTFLSPSGFFLIHYDITGKNAVPLQDNDNNGIPDYVDSTAYYFDYAYKVEVDSMGYVSPAPDNGYGGSDAYDVYLMNIGDYKYNSTPMYGLTQGDYQIYKTRKFKCFTSHIIIDNDFSPLDSIKINDTTYVQTFTEFGIACLKITAVHEFHHAIQYNYGVPEPSTPSLNEMTSTGMEYRIFPDTKDYQTHLRSMFKNPASYPFGSGDADIGYKYACFTQYINFKYGDVLLRRMWELISNGIAGYQALDNAFAEKGSSLPNEWCGFIPWLYYTGNRAIPGMYFKDAAEFPEFSFNIINVFSPPSTIITNYLQSFEIRAFREILPANNNTSLDTADVFVANTDLFSAIRQIDSNTPFTLLFDTLSSNNIQISNTDYYYSVTGNLVCDKLFFNSGNPTLPYGRVYPNPLKLSENYKIFFPAPPSAGLNEAVTINIFTAEMVMIFNQNINVSVDNQNRILMMNWNEISPELSSGVYIYMVKYKNEQIIGKFAVIK